MVEPMTTYAIAHLRTPALNEDVVDYIDRIQDTMDPYGGRFVVHGPDVEVMEGQWPGTIVVLTFPDRATAHAWYRSPAYQEILPMRTDHIEADVILADGVGEGYDPRATAAALRAGLGG